MTIRTDAFAYFGSDQWREDRRIAKLIIQDMAKRPRAAWAYGYMDSLFAQNKHQPFNFSVQNLGDFND